MTKTEQLRRGIQGLPFVRTISTRAVKYETYHASIIGVEFFLFLSCRGYSLRICRDRGQGHTSGYKQSFPAPESMIKHILSRSVS